MAQKPEEKQAEKAISLKYKPLPEAAKADVFITVPVLGCEININKHSPRTESVFKINQTKDVLDPLLTRVVCESARLVMQASDDLNNLLTGQIALESALQPLRALLRFLKVVSQQNLLECDSCCEPFNTANEKDGLFPVINSAGETYCRSCMQRRVEDTKPTPRAFNNAGLIPMATVDGSPQYALPNHPLVNYIDRHPQFAKKYMATIFYLIFAAARAGNEKKPNQHTWMEGYKRLAVANSQAADPEMALFLAKVWMAWYCVPPHDSCKEKKAEDQNQNTAKLIIQTMEDLGKAQKNMEQLAVFKQNALEFSAKQAHAVTGNTQYFEYYVDIIKFLFLYGTPLSEAFVKEFPPGVIKDMLQERLGIRQKKREKSATAKKVKHDLAEVKSLIPDVDPKEFDPIVADYNKYHQVFVFGREWILSQSGYDSAAVNKLYFGVSFCLAYDMAKKCLALAGGGEKYNQQLMEKIIDCAVNRIFGIYKEKSQKEKKDTFYFFAHVLLNSLSGEIFAVVKKVTSILVKKFKSIKVGDIFPDEFLKLKADDTHVFDESLYNKTYSDWRRRLGVDFAVMMLRYNARKKSALPPVTQVSPPRPLDHKSSPAMLLASSMPFLAAVSSFAAQKEESKMNTEEFLPDVFSQGMQEAEEQVTEQSKICLAELDALLSGEGDGLFNKILSEYEGRGAKCIKCLDVLINEGGIIEAKALGYILIDRLQGIVPKLRDAGCSEEQIAPVELLVEKDINEICKLMKTLGEVRAARNSFG